eukprot:6251294-Pyramimonas_sp.AAC.1
MPRLPVSLLCSCSQRTPPEAAESLSGPPAKSPLGVRQRRARACSAFVVLPFPDVSPPPSVGAR